MTDKPPERMIPTDPQIDLSYLGLVPNIDPDGATRWRRYYPSLQDHAHAVAQLAAMRAVIHRQILEVNLTAKRLRLTGLSAFERVVGHPVPPEPDVIHEGTLQRPVNQPLCWRSRGDLEEVV